MILEVSYTIYWDFPRAAREPAHNKSYYSSPPPQTPPPKKKLDTPDLQETNASPHSTSFSKVTFRTNM